MKTITTILAALVLGCSVGPQGQTGEPDAGDTDTGGDSGADAATNVDTDSDSDTDVDAGFDSGTDTDVDSDTDSDTDSDSDADTETETDTPTDTGADTDTDSDDDTETEATDTESDTGTEPVDTGTEPVDTDTGPDGDTDTDTEPTVNACGYVTMPVGTVCDPDTGDVWEATVEAPESIWASAYTYCYYLATGGFDDWRMPTAPELAALWRLEDPIILPEFPYECDWPEWAGTDCGHRLWSDYGYGELGYDPAFNAQVSQFYCSYIGGDDKMLYPCTYPDALGNSNHVRCIR